jgi:hypothetical protein
VNFESLKSISDLTGLISYPLVLLLLALRIWDHWEKLRGNLNMTATVNPTTFDLTVDVYNRGQRPITIKSMSIRYGRQAGNGQIVYEFDDCPKLLKASECFPCSFVRRDEIQTTAKLNSTMQKTNCLIWMIAETTHGSISRAIQIPDELLGKHSETVWPEAKTWVLSDLFVGFEPMPSVDNSPKFFPK